MLTTMLLTEWSVHLLLTFTATAEPWDPDYVGKDGEGMDQHGFVIVLKHQLVPVKRPHFPRIIFHFLVIPATNHIIVYVRLSTSIV